MTGATLCLTGGVIFDGEMLHRDQCALFEGGVFSTLCAVDAVPDDARKVTLNGGILSPGYVDVQVNGGGGIMLNDDPCVATLERMMAAHRTLGVAAIMPTLISDSADKTRAAIGAVQAAIKAGVPGIAGLHLEGPHLSVARKGAHDAQFIRPMDQADLDLILAAKAGLAALKVTIAPENVTRAQVSEMAQAGVIVSLGHSDADFDTCVAYADAGARCVTHLFNAMSQLGNRAPGLVGAALATPSLSAGMIADAVHVHPAAMKTAWQAKAAPGCIFLVSDAMAVAGSDQDSFALEGRKILRRDGQLRLEDGTLAGADLDLTRAVSVMVHEVGVPLDHALKAATSAPADLCGLPFGRLKTGQTRLEDLICISKDLDHVSWAAAKA